MFEPLPKKYAPVMLEEVAIGLTLDMPITPSISVVSEVGVVVLAATPMRPVTRYWADEV